MQSSGMGLPYIEIIIRVVLSLVIGSIIGLEEEVNLNQQVFVHIVSFVWLLV